MYDSKEKKRKITATTTVTRSLSRWLNTELEELGLIFDFSVRTFNNLKAIGFERLSDLLLFSRKGLVNGTGLTETEFKALGFDDQRRILDMEERKGAKQLHIGEPLRSKLDKDKIFVEGIDFVQPENITPTDVLLSKFTVLRNRYYVSPEKPWHWKLTPTVIQEIDAMLQKLDLKLREE